MGIEILWIPADKPNTLPKGPINNIFANRRLLIERSVGFNIT